MKEYEFGKLRIDPTVNPAILNTLTWDREKAAEQVKSAQITYKADTHAIVSDTIKIHDLSLSVYKGNSYVIADLPDGQSVIIAQGKNEKIFNTKPVAEKDEFEVFPVTDDVLHTYVSLINSRKGPKALGSVPRLGIGVRHTTCLWPGIFRAMNRGDFAANFIQNSVRELYLLNDLIAGIPPRTNHLFSFGPVPEGHSGSSFEGLWTYGVYNALISEYDLKYGADADHLQVKRGSEGIERTKKFIDAAKYYSFYTLDVSDILNYHAMWIKDCASCEAIVRTVLPSKTLRTDVFFFHRQKKVIGKQVYQFDDAQISRMIGKYWEALNHVEELIAYIKHIKKGEAFDVELSIDENPPDVRTFDTITTNEELLFLMEEIRRRNMPVTHLAPNFGVEKCTDYRCPDGLEMLERRISAQVNMANKYGFMLDCHSGDDLSKATRRIFGSASRGKINFKLSPSLQQLYGKVLADVHPEIFTDWYTQTYEYTKKCAAQGSPFAINALKRHELYETQSPSPEHFFFLEYGFAIVGMRDDKGQFINRAKFYDVSDFFKDELSAKLDAFLFEAADDLFNYIK
ncbi:hypothetical protein H0R92_06360 [Treponema sp. OMZ 840]|uniref:tagaturonate epimerase family protein n=1 Tax=Treponema sp. OMZ 840 TaxID=244313 RepID=UPI003D918329